MFILLKAENHWPEVSDVYLLAKTVLFLLLTNDAFIALVKVKTETTFSAKQDRV